MSAHDLIINLDFKNWNPKGAVIEVGSQRHGGEGSSFEFLKLAERYQVPFYTVDFSTTTHSAAKRSVKDHAVLGDGAEFIDAYSGPISILYLDNYDVSYNDEHFADLKRRVDTLYKDKGFDDSTQISQNLASALVHLDQAKAALPKMTQQCLVGIDDTFYRGSGRCWFGKGALATPYLLTAGFKLIANHRRGLLLARDWPQ